MAGDGEIVAGVVKGVDGKCFVPRGLLPDMDDAASGWPLAQSVQGIVSQGSAVGTGGEGAGGTAVSVAGDVTIWVGVGTAVSISGITVGSGKAVCGV
ncbi:MAG: hypothetical protein M5U34_39405 [Chloroflexi bacterium]|nr:hypothetical protein [Chloroflexota bacterium]